MLKINIAGTGFSMKFANGWTVSVQFGEYSYCKNRDPAQTRRRHRGVDLLHSERNKNKNKCINAEIAAWDANEKWYAFDHDNVKGWCDADEVADFIAMIKAKEK